MHCLTIELITPHVSKFSIGSLVCTANARRFISDEEITTFVRRHILGDWGELDFEDKRANEKALRSGGRLFSAYKSASGTRYWIITEADRGSTTILLPEDY